MVWVKLQGLFVERVCLFELVGLEVPDGKVIGCFEVGEFPEALLAVIDGCFDLSLLGLDDCQVV